MHEFAQNKSNAKKMNLSLATNVLNATYYINNFEIRGINLLFRFP